MGPCLASLAEVFPVTATANGRVSEISLNELGLGPEPINIFIDEIINATPKPQQQLGVSHLKAGDKINIYADFDTNDITLIKVHGYGLAQEIDFTNYQLSNLGDRYSAR